jgi:SAM-dependent methyltransferase
LELNPNSIVAVEPNEDMFAVGSAEAQTNLRWLLGSAESTGLEESSIDLVTMASSFHWPDTKKALREFDRVLGPNGVFAALWNPRITERSEVETRIDRLLESEFGVVTRVSSGRSVFANELEETLRDSGLFGDIAYMHSLDVKRVKTDDYIGAWTSVNDVQSQLGEERFRDFIVRITDMLQKVEHVEVHYLTRCWLARKSN